MSGSRLHTSPALGLLGLLLLARLRHVTTFSMGAPDSACQDMTPGHDHPAQSGPAPGLLRVGRGWVAPGQLLSLELATPDNSTFKGFIIQARDAQLKDQQVGSFVLSGDDASYLTCGRGIHNSITHRKSSGKTAIKAKWMAPSNFEGEVIFRYTFLQEYKTFWVGRETEKIRVSRDAGDEATKTSSAKPSSEDAGAKEEEDLVPSAKTSEDTIKVVDKQDDGNQEVGVEDTNNSVLEDDIPQPAQNAVLPKEPKNQNQQLAEELPNTPIYRSSTTTLPSTTTSTLPPRRELSTGGLTTDPEDPIFDGCDSTKACFGLPSGCVAERRCELILAYYLSTRHKEDYEFEMKGRAEGYIAMGLSRDVTMGEDLTTNCVVRGNGAVDIVTGYNTGHSGNKEVRRGSSKQPRDGIKERRSSSRSDGWIQCTWVRNKSQTIEGSDWDLDKDRYHVMLAQGRVDSETGDMNFHDKKVIAASLRGLGEVGSLESKSRLFIFLHGAFMLAAWVCSASLGIIMARYFKQTWTSKRCFNLDQWFIWHRTFMMVTWGLTMAGFILILLELRDISKTISTNPHAIIGFVTVGLCFIQPFLALIRCSPNHQLRPIFNWVHWLIGNVAQILAIVAIFYAVDLPKAQLPRPETDWLLVAFVAFHFLTHLVLSAINCNADNGKIGYSNYPPTMRHMARGHMFPDYEELKRDSPGSTVRLFVLVVYFIVNVIVSAALILLVVFAPTESKLVEIGLLSRGS